MAEIERASLFRKLDALEYKALESATTFCKLRGNPYVELVHWLHQILQNQDSDLHRIVRHFGINQSRLAADMTAALDRLPRGATSVSDFSPHLDEAVERGWLYASVMFGQPQVRTGHLAIGILKTPGLRNVLLGMSREFEKVKPDELTDSFARVVGGSPEDTMAPEVGAGGGPAAAGGEGMGPALMGKQEALARFTVDLTAEARKGGMDPIVGRSSEIRQVVDILMRRRQNNPILTGEAGVGKTAVVEGFAQRVAAGDVPPPLKEVTVRTVDLGLLQAGASMKGEFEARLRQLIEEVQASPKPIILFIDEAHTLIGAGGAAGSGDAANLLKPALARGTLRTIAATTWSEYKKYIEKDPALTRRFQVVKVDEPTEEQAIQMMRGLASTLEKHHRVQILDEALEATVKLSHRYIPARQLPDKAVSLLDTACARVAIGLHAMPAAVEDSQRGIQTLELELEIVRHDAAIGVDYAQREKEILASLEAERARFADLEDKWSRERGLVNKILELRARLRGLADGAIEDAAKAAGAAKAPEAKAPAAPAAGEAPGPAASGDGKLQGQGPPAGADGQKVQADRVALLKELRQVQGQLGDLQGDRPLILPSVDAQVVTSVVADWTGIPVGRMVKNEIQAVLGLVDALEKRVIGQRAALETIAKRVRTSRAGLDNPNRPIGVFLLAGPSGVGKTETALALAEGLYGGEHNLITINMSEFQEAHTVSTLKGAPPGYVGYGEGGVLTEAVRRRPYSIVLLDEVEKAHRDVHEIFYQVFDKGWMEDAEGRFIDFKNTIILLTTNAGSDLIMQMCKDPETMPSSEGIAKALRVPLLKLPPALLGRLVAVPYYPINDDMLRRITRLQLGRIEKRLAENQKIPFTYDDGVVALIASRCTEVESGARMVDAILTHTLLPEISREYLNRMVAGRSIDRVHVGCQGEQFVYGFDGTDKAANSAEIPAGASAS